MSPSVSFLHDAAEGRMCTAGLIAFVLRQALYRHAQGSRFCRANPVSEKRFRRADNSVLQAPRPARRNELRRAPADNGTLPYPCTRPHVAAPAAGHAARVAEVRIVRSPAATEGPGQGLAFRLMHAFALMDQAVSIAKEKHVRAHTHHHLYS